MRRRRRKLRPVVVALSAALVVTAGLWLKAAAINRSLREETETVRARADEEQQAAYTLISTMLLTQSASYAGVPTIQCDSVEACLPVRRKWLEATAMCWQGDNPPPQATKCSDAARSFVAANAAYMEAWGKEHRALMKR